ncbi:MAG: Ger(x)C family spore germination protein [Bacillota bacterium]|nr:Ger(x)C family spore germination protein [Bacillota bacterium]MDP4171074.1 Ger(x)C family spore germination protein [Bacillota bacterium]
MVKVLIFIIFLIPILTGCWSAKEISDLAIATGMGIDKNDKGEFIISIQLINPGEVAAQKGSGRAEVTTYKTKAQSIDEALHKLSMELPRQIYLSHIQIIVIGEEVARAGIKDTLDFLSRDNEFRSDFYLLIAKNGRAEDILYVMTPMVKVPSISIYTQLEMSEKIWAPSVGTNLDELITDLISEGKDPIITGVIVSGNKKEGESKSGMEIIKPPAVVKLKDIAVFKGDKLVGWLDLEESKGVNYINNNVKTTVGHIKCPTGGKIITEVSNAKSSIKSTIDKYGKPKINIEFSTEENIGEVQCKIDLSKPETIKKLEKIAEHRIVTLAEKTIKKAKKYNSDIFGFGEVVHRDHPKEWKKLKKNWKKIFPELEVEITGKVNIRRIGTITNSVFDKIKE